ncbi:hypothetical protein CMK12_02865 [Candidatus Poribacteria bacterium]|nr:hypothetical protein [Candidatus Poribacteria bacterium]
MIATPIHHPVVDYPIAQYLLPPNRNLDLYQHNEGEAGRNRNDSKIEVMVSPKISTERTNDCLRGLLGHK